MKIDLKCNITVGRLLDFKRLPDEDTGVTLEIRVEPSIAVVYLAGYLLTVVVLIEDLTLKMHAQTTPQATYTNMLTLTS